MVVDSRDRRFSMIGLGLVSPRVFPNPDGSLGSIADRTHLLYLYRGVPIINVDDIAKSFNFLLLRRRLARR